MNVLLIVALVCATVVYLYERTRYAYLARNAPPSSAKSEALPMDLQMLAMQESEPWARENAIQLFTDTYAETHDWDAVRRKVSLK